MFDTCSGGYFDETLIYLTITKKECYAYVYIDAMKYMTFQHFNNYAYKIEA